MPAFRASSGWQRQGRGLLFRRTAACRPLSELPKNPPYRPGLPQKRRPAKSPAPLNFAGGVDGRVQEEEDKAPRCARQESRAPQEGTHLQEGHTAADRALFLADIQ